MRGGGAEVALLTAALHDAVGKLKEQERATAARAEASDARAEASERMSGEIIASLTAGLLVVTLKGNLRIINPAGRRLLNISDDAVLDDYTRVLPEPLSRAVGECLSTRRAIARRPVRLDRDSGAAHLGVTVSPLFDESGTLDGAICLFTDLTAVKELEEQLRLKESLATVGELTAGIAHEFRNGLATIHGYGKLFDLKQLPASQRPYVEGIRAEAENLGQVVTNFLNFAKPAQLTTSTVDLRTICDRAAEELRSEARNLGGDITVRGDFGKVEGDEVLLRQAFTNLIRNARRGLFRRRARAGRRRSSGDGSLVESHAHLRRRQRPGHRTVGARTNLPSLLHVEAQWDRSRSRTRPEDHRLSQRQDYRRHFIAWRREPPGHASSRGRNLKTSARLALQFLQRCPPGPESLAEISECFLGVTAAETMVRRLHCVGGRNAKRSAWLLAR